MKRITAFLLLTIMPLFGVPVNKTLKLEQYDSADVRYELLLVDPTGNDGKVLGYSGGAWTMISPSGIGSLTASRALASDGSGNVAVSAVTSTELGYLSGVTSAIQSQFAAKAPLASPTFTGTPAAPTAAALTNTTQLATTAYVVSMGSTGGNSTADAGLFAKFASDGGLRAEGLISDTNLVMGSTNTTGGGSLRLLMGNNNVNAGSGAQNIVLIGNSNDVDTSAGYGMLFMLGTQNNFHTSADYGGNGYVLANGVQHLGVGDSAFATGYHNRIDGRGTLDTASLTTLKTGAQITGAGGRAMVALGAGTHNYWNGTVALSSHSNVDGKLSLGTLSGRSVENGAVSAGGSLAVPLKLSQGNDKRLILKPNHLYTFDFNIAAGFTSVQEWSAAWSYQVTVHQGASSTTPLIRSVVQTGKPRGSSSGGVPAGWNVAFSAATQELVCTLTLANPAGSDAAWTAHGSFTAVETQATYSGGGGSTANEVTALISDLSSLNAANLTSGVIAPDRIAAGGSALQVVRLNAAGTELEYATVSTGGGDVSAASAFGTDNVLIRSDGTGKDVQATGWAIDDNDNMTATVTTGSALVVGGSADDTTTLRGTASGEDGRAVFGTSSGLNGIGVKGESTNATGGVGVLARQGHANSTAFQIENIGGFFASVEFSGTANRSWRIEDDSASPNIFASRGWTATNYAALAGNNAFTGANTFNKAPSVPRTDLSAGTSLTIGTHYFDSLSSNRTLTFSGTPAEGNSTGVKLVVTNTPTLTIPSSKRNGEANSAITSLLLYPGVHTLTWTYINSEWILSDTVGTLNKTDGTTAPTANEDTGDGYSVGSVWIDTTNDKTYICVDATSTAAVWRLSGNAVTGTGDTVLATSPTLTTPNLGTPSALVVTNASGTASININGTVGATTPTTGAFTTVTASGTITGKVAVPTKQQTGAYTVGTTDANEPYGGVIYASNTGTISLPAIAAGMSVTVIADAAVVVTVDPNGSEQVRLEGTTLSAGFAVKSAGAIGEVAVFTYYGSGIWFCSSATFITNGS